MDLPSLNTLLKVNGLSTQSSPQQITAALKASGYSDADTQVAFALLQGKSVPTTDVRQAAAATYMSEVLKRTGVSENQARESSMFGTRIGVKQFWIASALSFAVFSIFFLLLEVTVLPLFTILSGVSFLALPDLALAPIRTVLLVGIGSALLIVPFVFFFILVLGLHLRRFHDLGLSGTVWCSAVLAAFVIGLIAAHHPMIAEYGFVLSVLLYVGILSIPGSPDENMYGETLTYGSVWGSMIGSVGGSSNAHRLAIRFILPVLLIQAFGLLLAFGIHMILPRITIPDFSAPEYSAAGARGVTETSEQ
jgi:uncharacterized membrane protein YhaH (DUF805 family)